MTNLVKVETRDKDNKITKGLGMLVINRELDKGQRENSCTLWTDLLRLSKIRKNPQIITIYL